MKEHIRTGFAIFPFGVLNFDVTSPADAGNKNHFYLRR
jgi:hypothetical protein